MPQTDAAVAIAEAHGSQAQAPIVVPGRITVPIAANSPPSTKTLISARVEVTANWRTCSSGGAF
jgi:hypothetical protein